MQIEFYEILLHEEQEMGYDHLNDDHKIKYFELKCKREPDMVTFILEKYRIPLDRALIVCESQENQFGIAYLKFRLGIKEEAIEAYLKVKESFITYL